MDLSEIVNELRSYKEEQEWFEFKVNWFEPIILGEYISALSNAAAFHRRKSAFFVWGIDDESHEVVGTTYNIHRNYNNEPYQNYLARKLFPSINFSFHELLVEGKRIVVLVIPAAAEVPTAFQEKRFIRIGSAKCNLSQYPKREVELFRLLNQPTETILTKASYYQDLTFEKLKYFYASQGLSLREETFVKNLGLKNEDGRYNILAQLLSDNSHLPLRVSIFQGKTKASKLLSVQEFGYTCLLYSLNDLLHYGEILNRPQADETNRILERKEVPLYDIEAYREALINAIVHNKWVEENEPMISIFSDRIEILSRGTLAPSQTKEGFFLGESIPINPKLSEIFLQLHLSEKSGRGIPKITKVYGKGAFTFRENSIVVSIPFHWINDSSKAQAITDYPSENIHDNKDLNANSLNNLDSDFENNNHLLTGKQMKILSAIKQNPLITYSALCKTTGLSRSVLARNISFLKSEGYLIRMGSNKTGFWTVLEKQESQ